MEISVLGIDIAKRVFELRGVNRTGRVVYRRRAYREELLELVCSLRVGRVVLEAGWSAQYWGRALQQRGQKVMLIAPQHVKPYVQTNKSDAMDAEAICEAARRKSMRFVSVKELSQQEIQFLHRVRSRYVRQRTALCNEIRGFLSEYGFFVPLGVAAVRKGLMNFLGQEEQQASKLSQQMFVRLRQEFDALEEQISFYDKQLKEFALKHPICKRLMSVSGVGPLTATALVSSVGDPTLFKNGRSFSASIGLVPRHSGTGGINRLGGISKRGDCYLRQLLVHGARSEAIRAKKRQDKRSQWVVRLIERRGFNNAVVALANKTARILWVLMTKDVSYNPELAAA